MEKGAGEVLICLHGLGGHALGWRHLMEELSPTYRVIAVDLRGHGQSGHRPEETLTIRALAEDILALMRGLAINEAHLCGHSLGGMIALEIFARRGFLVKSLILANTTAFFPPPQNLEEFLNHFDQLDMPAWARFMAPRLLRRGAPAALVEEVVETISATSRAAYRQGLIAAFQADYRWLLPLLDSPTLIAVGEDDQATPWSYARYLHHMSKNSALHLVPRAGHLAHQENPEEFNRLVRFHLEKGTKSGF
jgi:3-oxoadipate enol-lactonase